MHLVFAGDPATAARTGLPWPEPDDAGATALLRTVRQSAVAAGEGRLRLVLPGPGDVRGLPTGTAVAAAAVAAGEGILVGTPDHPGTGIVPQREGPDVLRWTVHSIPQVPFDPHATGLGEAEYAMRQAVRDSADALAALQTVETDSRLDPRALVADAVARSAGHSYPASTSARSLRILDSADQVSAILFVAERRSASLTLTSAGAAALEDQLRPLRDAVRFARLAAVNEIDQADYPT